MNVSFPPRPRRDRASGPGSKLSPEGERSAAETFRPTKKKSKTARPRQRFVGFRFDPEANPDSREGRVVRVCLEDALGGDSVVAVGRTPPGSARYFRYVATTPPPDGFRGEALPEDGVTKEACERWIRNACPRIKLRVRRREDEETKMAEKKGERGAAKEKANARAKGFRERGKRGIRSNAGRVPRRRDTVRSRVRPRGGAYMRARRRERATDATFLPRRAGR